jgi:hypothetical protein
MDKLIVNGRGGKGEMGGIKGENGPGLHITRPRVAGYGVAEPGAERDISG